MSSDVTLSPSASATAPRTPHRLWLYGLGMLIPALYFAWRYPLRGHSSELTDIGKLANYGVAELVGFVVGMVSLFGFYLLALRETRLLPTPRALPVAFGGAAALSAAMAWMYPVNAIDIFIYAARSRLFTEYGVNPNAAFPLDYWDDPYMHFASAGWAGQTSPYGPLWNLMAAPATAIGGDRIVVALIAFKALAVASVLLSGWVIVRVLAAVRPADAAAGALLFMWNPLVLWEGIANGHNDVVLALLVLFAVLAWIRRRLALVIPLLVVATLLKYVTVLLLPLAAVALWRQTESWPERVRLGLVSVGLSLLAAGIAFFPFYDVGAIWESIARQGDIFLTSPAAMLLVLFEQSVSVVDLREMIRLVGSSLIALTLLWLAWRIWERPERLARAWFEAFFIFLLVATWNFRPWYMIWPIALAALLPLGWPAWRMTVWAAGGLAAYGHYIWIHHWWDTDYAVIHNVGVTIMFGPMLLITLAELVSRRRTGLPVGMDQQPSRTEPGAVVEG